MNILYKGTRRISDFASVLRTRNHVKRSVKWVAGEKFIDLPADDVVVILLGRNMSHYLQEFYEYYQNIGARYFVYTDNGSNDNSLDIVSKWKNSVILSTDLNFREYQTHIRQEISRNYCTEGWRLAVDPDELFDYVGSDNFTIGQLAKSLLADGYTGLVAQMLDLVSQHSPIESSNESFAESIRRSKYYSLNNIKDYKYYEPAVPFSGLIKDNVVPHEKITWKFGGIRQKYFGENCCLTKHPLFFYKRGVKPFRHPHLTTGLKLADFTALLKHYKFSGNYVSRERDLLAQGRIFHDETAKRASVIGAGQAFHFDVSELSKDPSPIELSERGFLVLTDRAKQRYL